jgi:hypothetical protein
MRTNGDCEQGVFVNRSVGDLPGDPGLCRDCQHSRRVESDRGSVFFRCELSQTDPSFPKYPRLPVLTCSGYQPVRSAE